MARYHIRCPRPEGDEREPADIVGELLAAHGAALRRLLGEAWEPATGASLARSLPAVGEQVARGASVRIDHAGDLDMLVELDDIIEIDVAVEAYEHTAFPPSGSRASRVTLVWVGALVLATIALAMAIRNPVLAFASPVIALIAAMAATVRIRVYLESYRYRRTPPRTPLVRWPSVFVALQLLVATLVVAVIAGAATAVLHHTGSTLLAVAAEVGLLVLVFCGGPVPARPTPSREALAARDAADAIVGAYLRAPERGFLSVERTPT